MKTEYVNFNKPNVNNVCFFNSRHSKLQALQTLVHFKY